MPDFEAAARFERFARMRLEGRNDLIYRSYDLLTKERLPVGIKRLLQAAGQYIPHTGVNEPLQTLQARFRNWGHERTLGEIESLLHEFWVYQRIKHRGKKRWPYRDPADTQRLYEENEAALKASETD